MNRLRSELIAIGTLALVLLPRPAGAHLVTTGLGPVYDGISHVVMSPDDLVPIVALALLAGLNGPAAGRSALFAVTAAWLAGGLFGILIPTATVLPASTATASFLLLGSLTALDRRLSPRVVATLAVAIGLLHGWLNGVSIADGQRESIGLVGIASAAFAIVAMTSASVVALRAPWARLAVRVAGSWVAAIGLLMLGWSLRGAN